MKHPAKFTRSILEAIEPLVPTHHYPRVLDPFAGTGLVHDLPHDTYGVEIEREWATMRAGTIVADALWLPFPDGAFDAIVTSPCYGNRLADHHNARDDSTRRSYTHDLGRTLHPSNAGSMQWGDEYRGFHSAAWCEVWRVLKPSGRFVLNVKDHVRKGEFQEVPAWHYTTCVSVGFTPTASFTVETPSMKYGDLKTLARAPHEWVYVFDKIVTSTGAAPW